METPNLRKAGMEHILENWVEEYSDQVFRVCYLYLSDYALAEDALQDTWVKAWKALTRQSDFPEHEKTWLMRIAINTCKDYARTAWFRHVDRRTAAEEFPEAHLSTVQPDHSLSIKMESFAAAIMLGLKKKFNNVDHLGYCIMDAPVPEADYRKQYMVLFDSVPGGTGYLKQLMTTPDALMQVFELALKAMESCTCANDPDKDGCYHCLYAYRQSNRINNISRRTAVELLRKIISGKDSLEAIKGVSAISVNTLFDSELEKRFIEAIEQSSSPQCKVEITKVPVHGKEGYFLQIGSSCWEIELQVPFTDIQDVPIPSKADFVFWPKTTGNKQRPVAVFTDGFLYHKQIVDTDTNKRMAIRTVCGYPVWSLTWKDVQDRLSGKSAKSTDTLNVEKMPFAKYFDICLQKRGLPKWNLKSITAFDLLISYLAEPNADDIFEGYAQALSLAMIDQKKSGLQSSFDEWNGGFSVLPDLDVEIPDAEYKKVLFGVWEPVPGVKIHTCLPTSAITGVKTKEGKTLPAFDETAISAVIRFDDTADDKGGEFENAWAQFLLAGNLIQFLKKNIIATENGIDNNIYNWRISKITEHPVSSETPNDQGNDDNRWDELIRDELFDTDAISLARKLKSEGCPAPDYVGYEQDGEVVAELAWETKKICVQLPTQAEYRSLMESEGWKVFDVTSVDISNAVKEA